MSYSLTPEERKNLIFTCENVLKNTWSTSGHTVLLLKALQDLEKKDQEIKLLRERVNMLGKTLSFSEKTRSETCTHDWEDTWRLALDRPAYYRHCVKCLVKEEKPE